MSSSDNFPNLQSKSAQLYSRACKVLPGGNSRTTVFTSPYPIYAVRGSGSRIYDADGTERIDFLNNYTSLIHGHAHPEIVRVVHEQVANGTCFAHPTEHEINLAQLICDRIPSAERVRFMNTGTEAVMMAIKAARAFTSRPKIAKIEGAYHGSYDLAEVSEDSKPENWGEPFPASTPNSRGTPTSVLNEAVIIPFNDMAKAKSILLANAKDLAAILIDPMPVRVSLTPATAEFLSEIRRIADQHRIVLISDEVVSFRMGFHGAQGELNFKADITVLGKIIGGGFPVGAVCGSAEIMSVFDPSKGKPSLPHGGTFNANPVTMRAGLAAMELMNESAFAKINALGNECRAELNRMFKRDGLSAQVTGSGSLLRVHLHGNTISDFRSACMTSAMVPKYQHLYRHAINNGIIISPTGIASISTAMSSADVGRLAEVVFDAVKETRLGA